MVSIIYFNINFREDDFWASYAHLGDLRSLLPPSVNIMALTTTSTSSTFYTVCCRLSLSSQMLIGSSPNQSNICYKVQSMRTIELFGKELYQDIKAKAQEYPKTVIFFTITKIVQLSIMYFHSI